MTVRFVPEKTCQKPGCDLPSKMAIPHPGGDGPIGLCLEHMWTAPKLPYGRGEVQISRHCTSDEHAAVVSWRFTDRWCDSCKGTPFLSSISPKKFTGIFDELWDYVPARCAFHSWSLLEAWKEDILVMTRRPIDSDLGAALRGWTERLTFDRLADSDAYADTAGAYMVFSLLRRISESRYDIAFDPPIAVLSPWSVADASDLWDDPATLKTPVGHFPRR